MRGQRFYSVSQLPIRLLKCRRITILVTLQAHHVIIRNVGYCQVHVFAYGQRQIIAPLVCIYDALVMLQAVQGCFGVVERQVHIVGNVCEDIFQMHCQRMSHAEFTQRGQLGLQLGGHIRY